MYILSKQKDYYDGVVGTVGVDKTIVYDRQIVELENRTEYPQQIVELSDGPRGSFYNRADLNLFHVKKDQKKYAGSCAFLVGFCGKIYVGWKLYRELKRQYNDYSYYPKYKIDYCYDVEEVLKYIDGERGKEVFLKDQLDKIANSNVIDVFREFNSPVFVYDCEWSPDNYGGNYQHKFRFHFPD